MIMKIQRMIPPSAAPVTIGQIANGIKVLINGRGVPERLEEEVRNHFHVRHAFLVSSGKAALTVILRSLANRHPEKREVVIPAYTCYSVPSSIVKAGLEIVPCDLAPGTTDLDQELLREKVTKRTLCVIPTHLFGYPADMTAVGTIARERGALVVEDAAQALGGVHEGRLLGTLGDVGFFSFDRGKNITCGGGGIIITNNDDIAKEIRREHAGLASPNLIEDIVALAAMTALVVFSRPFLYWIPAGLPFLKLGQTIFYRDFPVKKLGAVKAGMLAGWQARLERYNAQRLITAAILIDAVGRYRGDLQVLNPGKLVPRLLRLPLLAPDGKTRDAIVSSRENKRVGISVMYPLPVPEIAEIRDRFAGQDVPVAKDLSARLLTVPTHPMLTERDRSNVLRVLSGGTDVGCMEPVHPEIYRSHCSPAGGR